MLGAVVANLMFDLDAVSISTTTAAGSGALARRGGGDPRPGARRLRQRSAPARTDTVAFAVGGYITAAYWFTSSTSFANPAVTIARMFSDTFAGIAPASVAALRAHAAGRRCALGAVRSRCCSTCIDRTRTDRRRRRHDPPAGTDDPPSCSSASTTPAARRWPPGYLQHLAGDRVEVLSAGSEPADQVNPVAVAGDGRGGHRHHRRDAQAAHRRRRRRSPTWWSPWAAATRAPIYPGKRYEDWELDDPAGQPIEAVRRVRDEIKRRVEALIAELDARGALA